MTEIDIRPQDRFVFDRLKSNGRITAGLRKMMTQQWNLCIVCGASPERGRPIFAGYDVENMPLVVGGCCGAKLNELATPVYWTNSLNLSVSDDKHVWRYMDISKFLAMLNQGGLYFPKAENLDDKFEGASGLARRESEWDNFYLDCFRNLEMPHSPENDFTARTSEEIEADAQRLLKSIKSIANHAKNLLVSCWHQNDLESEAIWRLYCPPPVPGVVIRSTVGQLWDACKDEQTAVVGKVHYMDFRKTFTSIQDERIFQKRLSLSHENEVRIVLKNDRRNPVEGRLLNCDLEKLISEIIISPFAPQWLLDVVASSIEKFGYSLDVKQSELLELPFY